MVRPRILSLKGVFNKGGDSDSDRDGENTPTSYANRSQTALPSQYTQSSSQPQQRTTSGQSSGFNSPQLTNSSTFGQPSSRRNSFSLGNRQAKRLSQEMTRRDIVQDLTIDQARTFDENAPTGLPQRPPSRPQSMIGGYVPPQMGIADDTAPELVGIFTFLNAHSNKLYQEGYFLKLNDLDSVGRTVTNRAWTECYAQLSGTVLSLWDAAALDAAGAEGEVAANFINLSDASIKMIESLPTKNTGSQTLQNVLSVSTAGKNRYLFHFSNYNALTQWTASIRLAMFENGCLQESYTGALIAGKGRSVNNIAQIMSKQVFPTEEWVRVRFGAGTPWRRCWCVISPPNQEKVKAATKAYKKEHKSAYDRKALVVKGDIKFYDSKKIQKKTMPIATISDAFAAYAIYPQSKALIDQSTLIKIEGIITVHSTPENTLEGMVFIMPEVHPAVSGFEMMLRQLFPIYDTFALYGRPNRLIADTLDQKSIMFALPNNGRHYGYLDYFDVVTLIQDQGASRWTAREWRKQLKGLTSTRMQMGRSGNIEGSRRLSSSNLRTGTPSKGVRIAENPVSNSSTTSLAAGRSSTSIARPGSADTRTVGFAPPSALANTGDHRRTVSAALPNSPRKNGEGQNQQGYVPSRLSHEQYNRPPGPQFDQAPPPPQHATPVPDALEPGRDRHSDEYNTNEDSASNVRNEIVQTEPLRPVMPPPAFSHQGQNPRFGSPSPHRKPNPSQIPQGYPPPQMQLLGQIQGSTQHPQLQPVGPIGPDGRPTADTAAAAAAAAFARQRALNEAARMGANSAGQPRQSNELNRGMGGMNLNGNGPPQAPPHFSGPPPQYQQGPGLAPQMAPVQRTVSPQNAFDSRSQSPYGAGPPRSPVRGNGNVQRKPISGPGERRPLPSPMPSTEAVSRFEIDEPAALRQDSVSSMGSDDLNDPRLGRSESLASAVSALSDDIGSTSHISAFPDRSAARTGVMKTVGSSDLGNTSHSANAYAAEDYTNLLGKPDFEIPSFDFGPTLALHPGVQAQSNSMQAPPPPIRNKSPSPARKPVPLPTSPSASRSPSRHPLPPPPQTAEWQPAQLSVPGNQGQGLSPMEFVQSRSPAPSPYTHARNASSLTIVPGPPVSRPHTSDSYHPQSGNPTLDSGLLGAIDARRREKEDIRRMVADQGVRDAEMGHLRQNSNLHPTGMISPSPSMLADRVPGAFPYSPYAAPQGQSQGQYFPQQGPYPGMQYHG